MPHSEEVLGGFYEAVVRRDFVAARTSLHDDLQFVGRFETYPSAEATTLVAEWHRVRDGKLAWARSAFDGRPSAALFAPAAKNRA